MIEWAIDPFPPLNLFNYPSFYNMISEIDIKDYKEMGFTQPQPGIKYDQGKSRMDLLDAAALEGLAKVLTFGANKYTQKGPCTCYVSLVNEIVKYGQKDFVNLATTLKNKKSFLKNILITKETIDAEIENILLPTNVSGWLKILMQKKEDVDRLLNVPIPYQIKNLIFSLHNIIVQYVEVLKTSASTTTTQLIKLEKGFVNHVTLLLVSLKEQSGSLKHSNTCLSIKEINGADNWRAGIQYSRLISSLLRHLSAIQRGELIDPESGLPHIDHLGCNWMFLSNFMKQEKQDNNDLYAYRKT